MKTKEFIIYQLANTMMFWLNYISSVGRSYVINEGSIKFPITEYLEHCDSLKINLEYSHPIFNSRRIDLLVEDNKKNNKYAFEFKFIRNGNTRTSNEKQRIFNDLLRLKCFDAEHKYFIIFGTQLEFNSDFQSIIIKDKKNDYIKERSNNQGTNIIEPQGFYTNWFNFDFSEKEFNLANHNEYYMKFKEDYSEIDVKSIKTKLVYLSNSNPTSTNNIFKVGIWEVFK